MTEPQSNTRTLLKARIAFVVCGAVTMALGLASRKYGAYLPQFVAENVGDALWAALVFWGLGFLAPQSRITTRLVLALLFAFGVEFSQLYHAPWIDAIRATRLGGLVLGYDFVWIDLARYTAGVLVAASLERCVRRFAVEA